VVLDARYRGFLGLQPVRQFLLAQPAASRALRSIAPILNRAMPSSKSSAKSRSRLFRSTMC
jgi:hypothetical protein